MSLSMSSRTVATAPSHISFSTDSRHPALVNKSPNLLLTSDLEVGGGEGSQGAKLPVLELDMDAEQGSRHLRSWLVRQGAEEKAGNRTTGAVRPRKVTFILCPLESQRFSRVRVKWLKTPAFCISMIWFSS